MRSSTALSRFRWLSFLGAGLLTVVAVGCSGEPAAPPPGADTDTPAMEIDQGEETTREEVMEGTGDGE